MARTKEINSISDKANILLNIFFLLYCAVCILPIMVVISVSFSSEQAIIAHGYGLLPREFTTDAYKFLFKDGIVVARAYKVTLITTVVGTILASANICMFAYPLYRSDFKFRKFFSFMVFFTMLFGGGLVPYYIVVTQFLHLKDNIWALILPLTFNAFWVIVMRTFYKTTIPESIIESARIDGAGELRTFFQIVFPLSLPGVATVAMFVTLNYWNDFFSPMLLLNKRQSELQNLQYLISTALTKTQVAQEILAKGGYSSTELLKVPRETFRMAMAVVAIGPIVLAYPFFQRYFIKGLTFGAVKG